MCLFPKKIPIGHPARASGMTEFECGCCPECLSKKGSKWALRAHFEAENRPFMMMTLTYDQYIRGARGEIIGEALPEDMHVHKKHCQDFIKRLRWHYPDANLRYIISAEYGKRTKRPHYHILVFGLRFEDLVEAPTKSKRGHVSYRSATLAKIWTHGICSVDSVTANTAIARYCTKYASKDSGADDTFMLFSRGIGEEGLLREFNGESYIIDGKHYPIPKLIWMKYLCKKHDIPLPRYVAPPDSSDWHDHDRTVTRIDRYGDPYETHPISLAGLKYEFAKALRDYFRNLRDSDPEYLHYREFWDRQFEQNIQAQKPIMQRILELPNEKYYGYKQACLEFYRDKHLGICNIVPRSSSYSSAFAFLADYWNSDQWRKDAFDYNPRLARVAEITEHLSLPPCLLGTNDSKTVLDDVLFFRDRALFDKITGEIDENYLIYSFSSA